MTKLVTALFFLLLNVSAWAQTPASDELRAVRIVGGRTPAETAVSVGRNLLGLPYVPHTLDQNATEQLVVNLRAFDCTTYLETVLALAFAHHALPPNAPSAQVEPVFRRYLTKLRYRSGHLDGYASRLHYFSDWLRDNERKGLLTDLTPSLPGRMLVAKPVSYMTRATYHYPPLRDPAVLRQMVLAETALNQQSFYFIPKKNIRLVESQLREGDIVMLTAARPGLDMKHVGLAVRQPSGQMHLLHASSEQGRVVISARPLSDYVLHHKRLSGIRVARIN